MIEIHAGETAVHGGRHKEFGLGKLSAGRGARLCRLVRLDRRIADESTVLEGQRSLYRLSNGSRRSKKSFREPPESYALRGILRLPPPSGSEMTVRGRYRGYTRDETIVIALGSDAVRSAEIHFSKSDLSDFQNGETIEVVAAPTGLVYQRVVDGTLYRRPYLIGKMVRRLDASEEVIKVVATGPDDAILLKDAKPAVGENKLDNTAGSRDLNQKRLGTELLVVSEEGQSAILVDGQWQQVPNSSRIPKKIMWTYVDNSQACWLAGVGGVTRISGDQVDFFGADDGLPDAPLAHIFQDSAGRIWVGSWGGGVSIFENDHWHTWTTNDGLRHLDVNGCVEDSRGRVWVVGGAGMVTGGRGVTIVNDGRFERRGMGEQLTFNVMSVDGDSAGRMLLGFIGGLAIIEPDFSMHIVKSGDGLPQRTPQATYIDSQGRIWAGTWGGGLVQIDQQTFQVLDEFKLPEAAHVRRIVEDNKGNLWVGSLEGLWLLSNATWRNVATPEPIRQVSVVATLPTSAAQRLLSLDGRREEATTNLR